MCDEDKCDNSGGVATAGQVRAARRTPFPKDRDDLKSRVATLLNNIESLPGWAARFVGPDLRNDANILCHSVLSSDAVADAILATFTPTLRVPAVAFRKGVGDGQSHASDQAEAAAPNLDGRPILMRIARAIAVDMVSRRKGVRHRDASKAVWSVSDETITETATTGGINFDAVQSVPKGKIGDWISTHQEFLMKLAELIFTIVMMFMGRPEFVKWLAED